MKTVIIAILCSLLILLIGCEQPRGNSNEMHFATSAEYPPFEYIQHNTLTGFDIELAQLIAKQLGKEAVFDNLQFSTVLPAVTTGQADAAIATLTITEARKKNFDFSIPYHFDGMAAVFKKNSPIKNASQLIGKKLATQFGSVMDIWLHQHFETTTITAFDNNNQAIEALLSGQVEAVVIDGAQAAIFSKKHPELDYAIIQKAQDGYGIAVKKNSLLLPQINQALQHLSATGELNKLKTKWLGTAI